jgi:hypothetical protein
LPKPLTAQKEMTKKVLSSIKLPPTAAPGQGQSRSGQKLPKAVTIGSRVMTAGSSRNEGQKKSQTYTNVTKK